MNFTMKFFRMKHFVFLMAAAATAWPADFFTGQAARFLIGQKTFTSQEEVTARAVLGGVGAVALANNTLFVSDSNRVGATPQNNRVLIYQNASGFAFPATDPVPQGDRCPACRGLPDFVLGQENFESSELLVKPTQQSLRQPTGIASDGTRLVVADTDNNRLLIWNTIPFENNRPADLVLGQPDFTTARVVAPPTASSLRGPQGVWIHNNRLFVADTGNNRVLIWNNFPTSNNQAADVVLGQPNFTTRVELDLTVTGIDPTAKNMLNPVSVTTDGLRLFVSDLGFNRVLMWNTVPTSNEAAADLVLGQPDFISGVANNSEELCASNGVDEDDEPTYPIRCNRTMEFPRFALSDGKRLFIADGGNDRIWVFNTLPTQNGQAPDVFLGQANGDVNRVSDYSGAAYRAAADEVRSPMSLAWDGTNLFVADPYSRRLLVFSLADLEVPFAGIRNAASLEVFATATVTLGGTITENDEVTVTIGLDKNADGDSTDDGEYTDYKYKIVKDDKLENVIQRLAALINATPDPNVTATYNTVTSALILTARQGGEDGNLITLTTAVSTNATVTTTTTGATLLGGQDAAKVAPGSLVSLLGTNLSDRTEAAPEGAQVLPTTLGNVELYIDGRLAPLQFVSPTRITAQMPWETVDTNAVNAYVRIKRNDGSVQTTMPLNVAIVLSNPGIFAYDGEDPRPAVATHYSNYATGTVSVDGTVTVGEKASIFIEDREYSYTLVEGDTLESVRDNLITLINSDENERVEAYAAGIFTRIRLRAKEAGVAGNGITYKGSTTDGSTILITATTPALCCANQAGAAITEDNPAEPGETIVITATGLGPLKSDDANSVKVTGEAYTGPAMNEPSATVSALAAGKTANVLYAGLMPGFIGLYEVHLELNSDIPTNAVTQVTIAQDIYVSNIVTIPVKNPNDEQ